MTAKKILTEPNKLLRRISEPVLKVGAEEQKLISDNAIHYQENWKRYSKSIF